MSRHSRKQVRLNSDICNKKRQQKKQGFQEDSVSQVLIISCHFLPDFFLQGIWSLADDESIASQLAKADADGEDLSSVDKRQFWDLALAIPELCWKWEAHLAFFLLTDQ